MFIKKEDKNVHFIPFYKTRPITINPTPIYTKHQNRNWITHPNSENPLAKNDTPTIVKSNLVTLIMFGNCKTEKPKKVITGEKKAKMKSSIHQNDGAPGW